MKVTRQTRLSALVGEDDGIWYSIFSTVGAVLSTVQALSFVPVGVVAVRALPAVSAMSCPVANPSVATAFRVSRSPPDAVTS